MFEQTNIFKLWDDPDFLALSRDAQIQVMSHVDEDFAKLSNKAKDSIVTIHVIPRQKRLQAAQNLSKDKISTARQLTRLGGSTLGAITGAIAGNIPGAVLGAGLGGAGVEAWWQVGEQLTKDPNAAKTSLEAMQRIGIAGGTEAGLELVGSGVMSGAQKLLAPFAKKVTPKAKAVIQAFKKDLNPVLTPAEATEHWSLDILQNISEASVFGGGRMQVFKTQRKEVFQKLADEFIDQFGERVTPVQFGEFFTDIIQKKVSTHRAVSNILYNKVDDLLSEGSTINIKAVQDFARDRWRILSALGGLGGENAGEGIVKSVINMDEIVDFETAKTARSLLLDKVREISVINKKAKGIGIANEMIDLFDKSIEKSLIETGDKEALEAWRVANRFYREGKETFDNEFTRTLIKRSLDNRFGAESVANYIFKPGNVTTMNIVKQALSPEQFKKVQSLSIQKIFTDAGLNTPEGLSGKRLTLALAGKRGSYGDDLLEATFNKEQISQLRQFADALTLGQAKQASGTGSMFIQLKQPGAVMNLAGFAIGGYGLGTDNRTLTATGAGIIVFAPNVVGRMLLNPTTARWLTEGVKLPASSPHVAGFTTRLLGAYFRIKHEAEQKEQ